MGNVICDFCSGPDVIARFKADSFDVAALRWHSEGDWAACALCAAYVRAGKWGELARHVAGSFAARNPMSGIVYGEYYLALRMTYDVLAANLHGETTPDDPTRPACTSYENYFLRYEFA